MTIPLTRTADPKLRERFMAVLEAKKALADAQRAFGHEPVDDWELRRTDGTSVRLSQLFGEHDDLLLVHNMGRGCSYCTLWADGLRGFAEHISRRASLVLCSNDPPEGVAAFRAERGWNFDCVSGEGTGFAYAMGFADDKGSTHPGVSAFYRNADGSIVRTGATPFGPGDDFCSVFPLFELLEGGVKDWQPR